MKTDPTCAAEVATRLLDTSSDRIEEKNRVNTFTTLTEKHIFIALVYNGILRTD